MVEEEEMKWGKGHRNSGRKWERLSGKLCGSRKQVCQEYVEVGEVTKNRVDS